MVVLVVREMDRASAYFGAIGKDAFVNEMSIETLAAECGDQRGVDIDNPVGEILRDHHMFEEPTHHDQVNVRVATCGEDSLAICLWR